MDYKFKRSIVGGTFDRFHRGHQALLKKAFEQSEHVIIGIATNDLFKDKSSAYLIEDYKDREQSVLDFLSAYGFSNRSEIVPIHDFYGTTLTDEGLDAIFITESNKANVQKINDERQKKSFHLLKIIIVAYVLGNDGEVISSERIRKGVINRKGESYAKLFMTQELFHLPENERDALRHPFGTIETDMGQVIASLDPQAMLIAVGDIVAAAAMQHGRPAEINVIDGKTRRQMLRDEQSVSFSGMTQRSAENPAGTITQEAANSLFTAITDYDTTHEKQLIDVLGEEDLLAIPAILLAPLQTVVLYGQFGVGIVVVKVSEQNKQHVQDLFGKFQ